MARTFPKIVFEQVRVAAITALGRLRVPESVGVLARFAQDGNPRVSAVAKAVLRKVIPTLTPAHYGILSAVTTPNLAQLLPKTPPTSFSVLQAAPRKPMEQLLRPASPEQ